MKESKGGSGGQMGRRDFLRQAATTATYLGLGGFSLLGRAMAATPSDLVTAGSFVCPTIQGSYTEKPCRMGGDSYDLPGDQWCQANAVVTCKAGGAYPDAQNFSCVSYACATCSFTCTIYFPCDTYACDMDYGTFACDGDIFSCSGFFRCDHREGHPTSFSCCGSVGEHETPAFSCSGDYHYHC